MSKNTSSFNLGGALAKRAKTDATASASAADDAKQAALMQQQRNPYLSRPTKPEEALYMFLIQARTAARNLAKSKNMTFPVKQPYVEIEGRLGLLKSPYGAHPMRVLSSGPKRIAQNGKYGVANAFICNDSSGFTGSKFDGGITRSNFTHWTAAGLSETSPISQAFGVKADGSGGASSSSEAARIKHQIAETEYVETVYGGYPEHQRVCFPGEHPRERSRGKLETKKKLTTVDIALPAAHYDLRVTLATETVSDDRVMEPLVGYTSKRLKRRRSYVRKDKSFAWQLDVTEVSTETSQSSSSGGGGVEEEEGDDITFEVEVELSASNTLNLINCPEDRASQLCKQLAQQLNWMMGQINPSSDVLEVDSFVREHPSANDVRLAAAQCSALKKFRDTKQWEPAIGSSNPSPSKPHQKFIGCMPVNFSRHNIEDVQRSTDGYYLSEKTDGVRYLLIFTGQTAVLIDRAMKGNQPIPKQDTEDDPFQPVLNLIQPGTVLDGEVVIHRKLRRPIFIVFDVLCCGDRPVLHLNFEERLNHLRQATFRTPDADRDMFAPNDVKNPNITLPLVRKNFVRRTELDKLLSYVTEERGTRCYRNGECHYHATDGIIFQPNRPYATGTDVHLLKWKYLDTVTIDVELLPPKPHYNRSYSPNDLRVGVLGEDGTMVDMTRYVRLPQPERLRLEADRHETKAKIAEVGFDPETGEWYYLTMRPDKIASNHISTVLGTLLELAESLGTNELRYRMNVRGGARDTYRKDVRVMQKQLLDHQRKTLAQMNKK